MYTRHALCTYMIKDETVTQSRTQCDAVNKKRIAYCVRQRTDHQGHQHTKSGRWVWEMLIENDEIAKEKIGTSPILRSFLYPPISNRKRVNKKLRVIEWVSALHHWAVGIFCLFPPSPYKKEKKMMVPNGIEAKLASHDRININNVAIERGKKKKKNDWVADPKKLG